MRYLLLPFFVIQLLISVAPSILSLLALKLLPYRSLIASFFIFSIAIAVLLISLSPSPQKKLSNSNDKLIEQKNQLESWLNKQPTHRDVLLNLSKVNKSLGNDQRALELLTQAQNLDPNNSVFQEN
jgi:hypothetical protein